jgi:hypothetical protein
MPVFEGAALLSGGSLSRRSVGGLLETSTAGGFADRAAARCIAQRSQQARSSSPLCGAESVARSSNSGSTDADCVADLDGRNQSSDLNGI